MSKASFSPKTVLLLAAAGMALFALSVILGAREDEFVATGGRAGPGAHSRSAIGYAGLYDALGRLGWNVQRAVGNTLSAVGRKGTLIVAEPDIKHLSSDDEMKMARAPRLLLVLPKWKGARDGNHSAWLHEVEPIPTMLAQTTLAQVDASGRVLREAWPQSWPVNSLGVAPSGGGFVQLVQSQRLRPVVGDDAAMLVGEMSVGDRKIWVLSDPDVMANHGIGNGDNIDFMLSLLNGLAAWENDDKNAPLVFDETVHGFQRHQGSPIKLLFRFPYWVATLLLTVGAILLFLAAGGRFGTPRKGEEGLDFGKAGLLANSSRLLDYSGHQAMVLKRYVDMNLRLAAQQLHAPQGLNGPALADWLDRVGRSRKVAGSAAAILRRTNAAGAGAAADVWELHACARDIHRWKGETLDGSGSDSRHSR